MSICSSCLLMLLPHTAAPRKKYPPHSRRLRAPQTNLKKRIRDGPERKLFRPLGKTTYYNKRLSVRVPYPPRRMNEMVAADGGAVAVAGNDDDI